MKWFKHDANANTDAKLKRVRMKYGMAGYGLYWYCLELVASGVEKHNITFELEHDAEIIAHDTGINYEVVQEMMNYFVTMDLFENTDGLITCMKMASRTDDYIGRIATNKLRTNTEQTTNKVVVNRIEDNRREENKQTSVKPSLPTDINPELWNEWLQIRKTKKAVNSPTALKALHSQLEKCVLAGIPKNKAITTAVENSWKSISPEWIINIKSGGNSFGQPQEVKRRTI